jgi:hypothetical protein
VSKKNWRCARPPTIDQESCQQSNELKLSRALEGKWRRAKGEARRRKKEEGRRKNEEGRRKNEERISIQGIWNPGSSIEDEVLGFRKIEHEHVYEWRSMPRDLRSPTSDL